MSDDTLGGTDGTNPDSSGTKWGTIAIIVGVIAVLVGGAVLLFTEDDDSDSGPSTTIASETSAAETTVAPATTVAPETTPATSAAPATTAATTTEPSGTELTFSIEDIDDGETIPVDFTCDGENAPPIITIEDVPDGVIQYAMVVDDPDAPSDDPFVHWVVYNIPGNSDGFTDGEADLTYGMNDARLDSWFGPCPPEGDGPHEYVFTLYGLDQELGAPAGLDGREVTEAIEPAVVAEAVVTASYERATS